MRALTTRAALHVMLAGSYLRLSSLALVSFAGGFVEAMFLVLITNIAFTLVEGSESLDLVWGPELSLGAGVGIALVLVVIRLALALSANALSARLTTSVIARVRKDLSSAFLAASWPLQQRERAGQLQELLTTFTQQGSLLVNSVTLAIVAGFSIVALMVMATVVDPLGALSMIVLVGVLSSFLRPIRSAIRRRGRGYRMRTWSSRHR